MFKRLAKLFGGLVATIILWFARTPAGSGINDIAAVASTGVLV